MTEPAPEPVPAEQPVEEEVSEPEAPQATVQVVGDPGSAVGVWRLVTYGGWQISVGPDGLLMLPRHLHPGEVAEFCGAITAAAEVGTEVIADNAARAAGDDRTLPKSRAIVREGPPPHGAMRMMVQGGPNQPPRGSIGRRTRHPRIAPPEARV